MNQSIPKGAIVLMNLRGSSNHCLSFFGVIGRSYIWAKQKLSLLGKKKKKTVPETQTLVDAHLYTPIPYKRNLHYWVGAKIHRSMEYDGKRIGFWEQSFRFYPLVISSRKGSIWFLKTQNIFFSGKWVFCTTSLNILVIPCYSSSLRLNHNYCEVYISGK